MNFKNILGASAVMLAVGLAPNAFGQSFTAADVNVQEGVAQAAVPWSFDSAGVVTSFVVDIAFDDDLVLPLSADPEGVYPRTLTGCIVETGGALNTACLQTSDTNVRITFFGAAPLTASSGVMTFVIDAGAEEGESTDLTAVLDDVSPGGTSVTMNSGSISIIGSDAVLTLNPDEFSFDSQDINDPAQTQPFVIGNSGVNDSLEVTSVVIANEISIQGGPTAFSVSPTCDNVTIVPGGSCTVMVTFDPSAAGTYTADLVVNSDVGSETAEIDGVATATADIVVTPGFGPVSLGVGEAGATLSANGTVVNNGSLAAEVACTLTGNTDVFSTDPSPLSATVAPGATVPFSLACALPAEAEEGDSFSATLSCNIDGDFAGQHDLTCGVSTFEPLPVPTMQNWALILFALMMLIAGGIGIRFFRA